MFFEPLKNLPITDIVQVGFVSIEEGIAEMTPVHRFLFIDFKTRILKLESIEQYSKLKVSFISEISFDFIIEEDMFHAKSSISELVLTDTMANNKIGEFEVYGRSEAEHLVCDALSFKLTCGQELFFDPTFFFGINIGGAEQKKVWLNNFPNSVSAKIHGEILKF